MNLTRSWRECLWLIVHRIIREHGIAEQPDGDATPSGVYAERAEAARKRCRDRAEFGAMSITVTVSSVGHVVSALSLRWGRSLLLVML